jgi:mRNA m6A methyltransferase non-catalytic subunit
MMEGSESSQTHSKRDVEDSVEGRGSRKEDEGQGDVDDRKTWSGKSRKHVDADGVEDPDDGRRQSSADRSEPRRKYVSSPGRAYSGDEDDYDVPKDSHISKVPRRSPEERSERRSSSGYNYRDGVSSRRREVENEWDSSRRSRGRYESSKGASSYGNRYDSSDSIEIRPNRSLDFGVSGTNDPAAENKRNYRNGEGLKDRYYDDAQNNDQNIGQGSADSPAGKGGSKGPTLSDTSGAGQSASSSMVSSMHHQGLKGGRPSRAVRGRSMGRDPQRMGVPMPMMPPPPYGPLGLPPGTMQPMGPNMSHSSSPLGPGIFMPPFPGPLVWAGARGVDMSMLAVPPNLHIPPPVAGSMFGPSVGVGPSHNFQLDQTTGRGGSANSPIGFNPMPMPSRELLHDKPPGDWTLQRNSGPAGKAPSRGEQNDYSQNFVDTGMRPQNFIRELELTSVVEDYPKLRELIQRKDEIVSRSASAPMYYKCDLKEHVLSPEFFSTKFDVILVDPPWEEYVHRAPGITDHIEYWTTEEIMNLKIEVVPYLELLLPFFCCVNITSCIYLWDHSLFMWSCM